MAEWTSFGTMRASAVIERLVYFWMVVGLAP
jgi:hypothetical protein